MDEVNNEYIQKALNELIPIFGIREFINHHRLIYLIESGKIKECIRDIASLLGLPIEINISYVPKGYRPGSNDGFHSTQLVKTDQNNRGINSITAQVSIPSNLPMYGTPRMINFPISVRLSTDCAENPSTLISVMAHELSHIVLYSMMHKEKENEFYTDLTSMLLGFAGVMKIGRKVIKTSQSTEYGILSNTIKTLTETTTYHYLSDENFDFAFNKIESILNKKRDEKNKIIKNIKKIKRQLNKTKGDCFYFEKYLEYLDKNFNQKISREDGYKITAFHGPDYMNNFKLAINKSEKVLEDFSNFVEKYDRYTQRNQELIQQYENQLKLSDDELSKQRRLLQGDMVILEKYIGTFYKLRLRLIWLYKQGLY